MKSNNKKTKKLSKRAARKSLGRDTHGLSSVEYLILLVVIAVAGIAVWQKVGKSISDKAAESSEALDGLGGDEESADSTTPSGS